MLELERQDPDVVEFPMVKAAHRHHVLVILPARAPGPDVVGVAGWACSTTRDATREQSAELRLGLYPASLPTLLAASIELAIRSRSCFVRT